MQKGSSKLSLQKKDTRKEIEVWADWEWLPECQLMGRLFVSSVRGKEIFSFEYDSQWLQSKNSRVLDPGLVLDKGLQYADPDRGNFGIFLDSSPDRWGRVLMQRREDQSARKEKRTTRNLVESDFLLGVHDLFRTGGIRFKSQPKGPFVDHRIQNAAPPWTSLQQLERASLFIEQKNIEKDSHYGELLEVLVALGSPLGGARPKASVTDKNNHLWIAKFPSRQDRRDVGGWEKVVHDLAKLAGLEVSPARIEKFSNNYHTFLTKRFDRDSQNKRIHFASAMNLLQRKDGEDHSKGASYLELAEFIASHGSDSQSDLQQLWRRIVFFICVSNTDDHLRNHGFLLTPKGWKLSPAYDMNAVPTGEGLSLNISETDNSQNLELALEVCEQFRLKTKQAQQIIKEICKAVAKWEKIADKVQLSRAEKEQMSSAFRYIK